MIEYDKLSLTAIVVSNLSILRPFRTHSLHFFFTCFKDLNVRDADVEGFL